MLENNVVDELQRCVLSSSVLRVVLCYCEESVFSFFLCFLCILVESEINCLWLGVYAVRSWA